MPHPIPIPSISTPSISIPSISTPQPHGVAQRHCLWKVVETLRLSRCSPRRVPYGVREEVPSPNRLIAMITRQSPGLEAIGGPERRRRSTIEVLLLEMAMALMAKQWSMANVWPMLIISHTRILQTLILRLLYVTTVGGM